MTLFVFTNDRSNRLEPIARTGTLRARVTSPPSAPPDSYIVIETVLGDWRTGFNTRELSQLYHHTRLTPVLDAAVALLDDQGATTRLPAVDRRTWELGVAVAVEWTAPALRVIRFQTPVGSAVEMVEAALLRRPLGPELVAMIGAESVSQLRDLGQRAMDAWREALAALAEHENVQPAQDELLRLASVARSARNLATDSSVPTDVQAAARELMRSCEAATTTLSASLTASLLAAQHRVERGEVEGRRALERGQRRLAATAAALIFPTIVVGLAGANFVQPSSSHRWWAALLTIGAALVAAAVGIALASFISSSSDGLAKAAAWSTALAGGLLVLVASLATDH